MSAYTGDVAFAATTLYGTMAYTKPRKGLYSFYRRKKGMDRYAIFVDAGYFFAAGAAAAFSTRVPRKHVAVKSPSNMIKALLAATDAIAATGHQHLLRIYWYDAMPGPSLSMEQTALAMLPSVKIRLGTLNRAGEQKGVDSLMVTDIIDLAKNRAIAEAIIVSGDEDLRIAVQVAQSYGVRVHILAAGDPRRNVSSALQMEADSVNSLGGDWFTAHLQNDAPQIDPAAVHPASVGNRAGTYATQEDVSVATHTTPALDDVANAVIAQILDALQTGQLPLLVQHFASMTSVPPEYDRRLIAEIATQLGGRRLESTEMRRIRGMFITAIRQRNSSEQS